MARYCPANKKAFDALTGEVLALSDIKNRVIRAVEKLCMWDVHLLRVNSSEQSITHRLGVYMQGEFPAWHVDCEYNRVGTEPKTHAGEKKPKLVIPDVVVHHRNEVDNLLAIEVKKHGDRRGHADDLSRLKEFRNSLAFQYQYTLFLALRTGGPHNSGAEYWVAYMEWDGIPYSWREWTESYST